jgi:hypothetical protein
MLNVVDDHFLLFLVVDEIKGWLCRRGYRLFHSTGIGISWRELKNYCHNSQ